MRPCSAFAQARSASSGLPVACRAWANALQGRTNHNKATCALANKLARICYATLRDSQPYGLPAPRFNHKIERTAFAVAT